MSGKGNCYHNSMVETFFKSTPLGEYEYSPAEGVIFQYINGFYNPRRRHLSLGGKSPLAFE
jgi:putative transposase